MFVRKQYSGEYRKKIARQYLDAIEKDRDQIQNYRKFRLEFAKQIGVSETSLRKWVEKLEGVSAHEAEKGVTYPRPSKDQPQTMPLNAPPVTFDYGLLGRALMRLRVLAPELQLGDI